MEKQNGHELEMGFCRLSMATGNSENTVFGNSGSGFEVKSLRSS